ncbi:MAG TPA: hypothetical protein VMV69_23395 [Pirellulales bacterium]|nr:hypothetical protein [Pirellulales bacterium]
MPRSRESGLTHRPVQVGRVENLNRGKIVIDSPHRIDHLQDFAEKTGKIPGPRDQQRWDASVVP